ncbi:ABC transporter substrate-binding protein [Mesorhizobium australicum]|uniref:Amino acid/amide ABC transporter substrate-binding protein, HAAT family n=1 Tax=Mesorhizobium australicum TaxID=536018 RepID=A0A1X7MSX1_9HYPH|nr:ABC transporter substrate-binding protein [Mesorhizobium australicum]SMH27815.1 amino acid/amide ABC transporter substrate-binding protein, HAAT family [Mesorhizobium australicum]
MKRLSAILPLLAIAAPLPAFADVNVCVIVSATGPAASLGIPEQNTVAFLPKSVGDTAIRYVVYDDATDPTGATRNARKCVEDEKADVIIGSSTAPTSAAAASVAAETGIPIIALAPVNVPAEVEKWTFRSVQKNEQMASALIAHMKGEGVKKLGFIGYADAYGEDWLTTITPMLAEAGIALEPVERFARSDTSVTGQVLRLLSAQPDAVIIVGSGTPSALPATTLSERGYKGTMYQTHGSATRDFIRVGGAAVEGTFLPVGPVVVARQLPDDHPSKEIGVAYTEQYEAAHGEGSISAFGGMMYDAGQLVAAAIPGALEKGAPGTPEFRAGLRDGLENLNEVVSVNGVYSTSPDDHFGHDERSRVLVTVENGDFRYVPLD